MRSSTELFAVIRRHGPAWHVGQPLERQPDWPAHAAFMDALTAEGFIVLGGPLDGTDDVLLIVRAGTADEVRARLGDDPWIKKDLLREINIAPWTLRLGTLDR